MYVYGQLSAIKDLLYYIIITDLKLISYKLISEMLILFLLYLVLYRQYLLSIVYIKLGLNKCKKKKKKKKCNSQLNYITLLH